MRTSKVIPISDDPHWVDYAEYLHPLPSLSPRRDQVRWTKVDTLVTILSIVLVAIAVWKG